MLTYRLSRTRHPRVPARARAKTNTPVQGVCSQPQLNGAAMWWPLKLRSSVGERADVARPKCGGAAGLEPPQCGPHHDQYMRHPVGHIQTFSPDFAGVAGQPSHPHCGTRSKRRRCMMLAALTGRAKSQGVVLNVARCCRGLLGGLALSRSPLSWTLPKRESLMAEDAR